MVAIIVVAVMIASVLRAKYGHRHRGGEEQVPAEERAETLRLLDIVGLTPRENFTLVIDDREVARFATDDRGSIDRELQEGETLQTP